MNRLGTALVAASALALSFAAPAHADVPSAVPVQYMLSVVDDSTGEVRRAALMCGTVAAGTHPRASDACAAVAAAGSIERVEGDPALLCTLEYRPVTATAEGAERYERTFGNICQLKAVKGSVFDF